MPELKKKILCQIHFVDNLKISDFGLATVFRYQGNTRQLEKCCGTVPYLAPEVLSRKPYDAEPADIWSCAVILVALLAGGTCFNLQKVYFLFISHGPLHPYLHGQGIVCHVCLSICGSICQILTSCDELCSKIQSMSVQDIFIGTGYLMVRVIQLYIKN